MKRQIKAAVALTDFDSMIDYLESKLQSFGYTVDVDDSETGIPEISIKNSDDSMPLLKCDLLVENDGTFEFAFSMKFPVLEYNDLVINTDDFIYYLDVWKKVAKVLTEFMEY